MGNTPSDADAAPSQHSTAHSTAAQVSSGVGSAASVSPARHAKAPPTHLMNLVDGQLVPPTISLGFNLVNGSNSEVLSTAVAADEATVQAALAAAMRVHESGEWRNMEVSGRCKWLSAIADELEKVEVQMAEADARETGVLLEITTAINGAMKHVFRGIVDGMSSSEMVTKFHGAAGDIEVSRHAWGPALIIAPWNVPAGTVVPKIGAALAAGCPVIVKPSEWAPTALDLLARAVHATGMPAGVFQLLHGAAVVGAALVADHRVRSVNFTGSHAVGCKVIAQCAMQFKPALMELGGSNVMIVSEKCAGIESTIADAVIQSLTNLNGQWCAGLNRLFLHRKVAPAVLKHVSDKLAAIKLGPSTDPTSTMGPQSNAVQFATLQRRLGKFQSLGGTVLAPTQLPAQRGYYFAPTLVSNLPMEHCLEELFGPMATVHFFDTVDEATRQANMASGMLQCYVFSPDTAEAWAIGRQLNCGLVMVNGVGFGFEADNGDPSFSYWGTAGLGDDGPLEECVKFFTGNQVLGNMGTLPQPRKPKPQPAQPIGMTPMVPAMKVRDFRHKYYWKLDISSGPHHLADGHSTDLSPPTAPVASEGNAAGAATAPAEAEAQAAAPSSAETPVASTTPNDAPAGGESAAATPTSPPPTAADAGWSVDAGLSDVSLKL